jgi:hypothetical protein
MKADATAENKPAYFAISGGSRRLAEQTHEYQGSVEVVVVFLVKVAVVFVRLFSKVLVEACARVRFLFREGRS